MLVFDTILTLSEEVHPCTIPTNIEVVCYTSSYQTRHQIRSWKRQLVLVTHLSWIGAEPYRVSHNPGIVSYLLASDNQPICLPPSGTCVCHSSTSCTQYMYTYCATKIRVNIEESVEFELKVAYFSGWRAESTKIKMMRWIDLGGNGRGWSCDPMSYWNAWHRFAS